MFSRLSSRPQFARRPCGVLVAILLVTLPIMTQAAPACVHQVSMVFTESAPRDRFEIRNDSSSGQSIQRLTLDLSGSAGRLIFDTIEGGAGVDVFQPFRSDSGDAKLKEAPLIQDGSSRFTLNFTRFEPGQHFEFSIDVDDRLSTSDLGQTRVSGREMEGALMAAVIGLGDGAGTELRARVDGSNRAQVKVGCP